MRGGVHQCLTAEAVMTQRKPVPYAKPLDVLVWRLMTRSATLRRIYGE